VESTTLPPQDAPVRKRRTRRLRLIVALPIAALALSGCTLPKFGAVAGDTQTSQSVFHLWQGFSVAAVIIGGFTFGLILWSVFRYRRKSADIIPAQVQYHLPAEVLYTVIPILVIIGLFISTIVVENKVVANPKTNVTVDVLAFQWGWKFTYPGSYALVYGQTTASPEMVIPAGENVHINLRSSDVIHGFYVHDFNFSRFAQPGIKNEFTFNAVKTGTFFGQCTQLCGLYHSLMFFKVKVVTPQAYQVWLKSFNTPAGIAAYNAANTAASQQTSSHVDTKSTSSSGAK